MARNRVPGSRRGIGRWSRASSMGLSLVVALLPKCSACLVVHGSILGVMGLTTIPQLPRPVLAAALLATLGVLAHTAHARQAYGPVVLAGVAALLLLAEFTHAHGVPAGAHSEHLIPTGTHGPFITWAGGALLFVASLWTAWPHGPLTSSADAPCGKPCHTPANDLGT